jgi:phosphate/phosphite/phosphonate ABC transporter binding protein
MRLTLVLATALLTLSTGICLAQEILKIGILAKDGPVKAIKMWKSTADFLTANIQGTSFEIVPLGFEDVYPAVEAAKVDFFLVNSSMFITAKVKYGATAVATLVNSRKGQPLESFGGVIFTVADNNEINSLADLKGKTFMAVDKTSFGGWQMALKEIMDAGLDPNRDFAKLEFGAKHENVVLAVQNGAVQAGTVRTDTLERMAADGTVEMEEFKIINKQSYPDFPFVCSTALYPEWPLAKIQKTSDAIAAKVVEALKKMKPEDQAAKDAKVVGWVAALDYTPVEELQKTLKIDAFAE